MSNNITTTAVPTDEGDASATSAGNSSIPGERTIAQSRRSYKASGPVSGRYLLTRGVRTVVAVSSAGLLIAGLALAVVGGLGKTNEHERLSGLNALITGIMLLITGVIGCTVVFMSRANTKVKRWTLIALVAACHVSGAFAVQCTIIASQLVAIDEECDDTLEVSPDMETNNGTTYAPDIDQQCIRLYTPRLICAIALLVFAIVGFILGIICSIVVYLAAPRIWCCMCEDLYDDPVSSPRKPANTLTERQAMLAPGTGSISSVLEPSYSGE